MLSEQSALITQAALKEAIYLCSYPDMMPESRILSDEPKVLL